MPETSPADTPDVPVSAKTALDADTDQALAWTREARKKLSADESEDALYLKASGKLAETLRTEFPAVLLGRVLMSASQSMAAIQEHPGLDDADSLLSVLALAAEQLAREDAEAGRA